MSRHSVSNHAELSRIIRFPFTAEGRIQHRALIVIELAPYEWLKKYAMSSGCLMIASDSSADRADQISAYLGGEHHCLIHKLKDPMDAGLLAAAAGTVTNQGMLILATPFRITQSGNKANNEEHSGSHHTSAQSHFSARFSRLIAELELRHPTHVRLISYKDSGSSNPPLTSQRATQKIESTPPRLAALREKHTTAKQEQNLLLNQACQHLTDNSPTCVTVVGKRGRGKSTLLARIANWLNRSQFTYCVTALNKSALSSFHRHTDHSSESFFKVAADTLQTQCDYLLVDEAANLPLAVLNSLIEKHDNVIFCTTVEGYENAGRAFQLRFSEQLTLHFQNPLTLSPKIPWRWLNSDPIEELMDALLLNVSVAAFNAGYKNTSPPPALPHNDTVIEKLSQQALVDDEYTLQEVYGLLRETHYQSSVKDLQHLLDGQGIQLWVLRNKHTNQLLAACLLTNEASIEVSIHQAIVNKQRRLPHHLLSQLLAQSANSTRALSFDFARVIRISVAHSHRRLGLGSRLLRAVELVLFDINGTTPKVQAMGASFAKDPTSLSFWQANGYTEFHEGYRKNPRTGLPSAAVLKTPNNCIRETLEIAAAIHADNLNSRSCTRGSPKSTGHTRLTPDDTELLAQFVSGHRSLYDTYAALSRLSCKHDFSLSSDGNVSRKAFETALRKTVSSLIMG